MTPSRYARRWPSRPHECEDRRVSRASAAAGLREEELLQRARTGDESAFTELAAGYRTQLQLHCYRIVGSVQDAEDLVQETLLAAWRGLADFQARAERWRCNSTMSSGSTSRRR